MTHNRLTTMSTLTSDAKSILREIEYTTIVQKTSELLARANADPLSVYADTWRRPRFVVWELTLACNMRCGHCGSTAGVGRKDELSLDEMFSLCDQLGELKCERLTLLGGEPLIHPYWRQVTGRLQDSGVRVNVITNGWTLPDPAVCDAIAESGLTIAGISVDGMKKSHDKLRREGSFERISIGMDLLRERKVPIAVCTVVTNDSISDLEALYGFLVEKGVSVWQLQIASPLGRLKRDDPLLIKPTQIKQIYNILNVKRELQRMHIDLADDVGYYCSWDGGHIRNTRKHITTWSGCHAGIEVLGIDSNGDIKGCQSLPSTHEFVEGNIRQNTLREIWNGPNSFSYTRNFRPSQLGGFCSECSYGNLCKGGCSSAALAYSGKIGENPMCAYRFEMEKIR